MNVLDFLIVLPIAYFSYRGFKNGLIKEVLSIVGIILAVFLSFQYMDEVASIIRFFLKSNDTLLPAISAIIIFVTTISAISFIALMGKRFMETIKLNSVNRLTGMLFGFLKSSIFISAILLLLTAFSIPAKQTRDESITYPYIIPMAPWAYNMVANVYPGAKGFKDTFNQSLNEYDRGFLKIRDFEMP